MSEIINARKLTSLALLLVLIVIGEIFLHYFNFPTWPAFLVMILFILGHMDEKTIALPLLVGGLVGIFSIIPSKLFLVALAPAIGAFPAKILFILIFVTLILLFKDVFPIVFNTYAFLFLVIAALVAGYQEANPVQWMALQFFGGGFFILGLVGVKRIVFAIFAPKAGQLPKTPQ